MKKKMPYGLSPGKVGAIGELAICADLMRKGYGVYRSVSQSSDFDIVAIKDEKIIRVEVRSGSVKNGKVNFVRNKNNIVPDVYAIIVHRLDKILYFPEL